MSLVFSLLGLYNIHPQRRIEHSIFQLSQQSTKPIPFSALKFLDNLQQQSSLVFVILSSEYYKLLQQYFRRNLTTINSLIKRFSEAKFDCLYIFLLFIHHSSRHHQCVSFLNSSFFLFFFIHLFQL